jgi:hypothetical protein
MLIVMNMKKIENNKDSLSDLDIKYFILVFFLVAMRY